MSLNSENKTLSRLMSAVGKTKIYKDTSKVVQGLAVKTVDCAARTTTTASKHYMMMKKKYDEDELTEQEIASTTAERRGEADCLPDPLPGNQPCGVQTNCYNNESIEAAIVPKYRIIKKTDVAISNDTTNQSIVCYIEMAGVKSSTIELTFYYSEMLISGKKQYPSGLGDTSTANIISESIVGNTQYGVINCKIQLPINVNEPHKVETNYADGVLIVSIPTNSYIEPVVLKYKKSRSKNI